MTHQCTSDVIQDGAEKADERKNKKCSPCAQDTQDRNCVLLVSNATIDTNEQPVYTFVYVACANVCDACENQTLPSTFNILVQTSVGIVKYVPEDNEVLWNMKSFPVSNFARKFTFLKLS